jgi:hypothetical protein
MFGGSVNGSAQVKRMNFFERKLQQDFGVIPAAHATFQNRFVCRIVHFELGSLAEDVIHGKLRTSLLAEFILPLIPLKTEVLGIVILRSDETRYAAHNHCDRLAGLGIQPLVSIKNEYFAVCGVNKGARS